MLSVVLVSALAGFLAQSAPAASAGNVAKESVATGLTKPDQTAPAAVPKKPLTPEQRADIFMARKRFREALEQYQMCDQKSAVIANKIGIAYHQLLDLRNAMKYYKQATKLDHNYGEAFNNIGTIYYSQRSYGRAIRFYKKALHISPNSATVWSNLGSAWFSRHHIPEAIEAYTKALEIDPDVFNRTAPNGVLLQEQSVEDKAKFHYYMATIFAKMGNSERTIQYIRKALEEGFKDRKKFVEEPEFAFLKGNPDFEELMKKEPREL